MSVTTIDPALQRWAIAWGDAVKAQRQLERARRAMAEEHDAALAYVRHRGGQVTINLLDGSKICVEDYRDSFGRASLAAAIST